MHISKHNPHLHSADDVHSTFQYSQVKVSYSQIKFATLIAFLAWVFAVYDFVLFGTLLPVMGQEYQWTAAQQAEVVTWIALGGAIVTFILGPIVDRFGRRPGIIFTMIGAAFSSALTSLGTSFGMGFLIFIRSIAGLGYAEQGVNATYLTELYASSDHENLRKRQGLIYSLVQSGWPVGALSAAGLTAVLLPYIGWKGCFIVAAIPAFLIGVIASKIKETPQYLRLKHYRHMIKNGDNTDAADFAANTEIDIESKLDIRAAFQGKALRPTLFLSLAFLLNWFAAQVFAILGTTVIVNVHQITFQNSLWILVISNFVGFIGYLFHGWMGDKIGRRNTIAIAWILGGFSFYLMIIGPSSLSSVITFYSLGLFFLIGAYSALMFFIAESFATQIRATCGSIVSAMGPLGAVLAGIGITSTLSMGYSWASAAIWFGALPCVLSGICILLTPKTN